MAQPTPLHFDNLVMNGQINGNPTLAQIEAAQTAGTHVGTVSTDFAFVYAPNQATPPTAQRYYGTQILIADASLYAALNAISAPIVWSN